MTRAASEPEMQMPFTQTHTSADAHTVYLYSYDVLFSFMCVGFVFSVV